ncbi:hypothetical protein N866_02970 [Actinotalea ferrariae CF5-4]|uniref:MBG domain-containing protein n=1 Tax=Actinotalea ferrariae CF5-4 TaxID=948458 RepID=A0A021VSR6_9CELL|nr:hypothetical protein N866_02970 [Actinotalea ferrariae CF5-4]
MHHARVPLVRRLVAVLATAAVTLALSVVLPQTAQAEVAPTPPNIIDYNRVATADWPALTRFERQAAEDVLANHSLPASDFDAVRGWARNQVRMQMWANLVVIIKKAPSSRTADEQAVYRWFQGLVQTQNVEAARASVDEFIRYSGLTEQTYTTSEPVNYNDPNTNLATGGYCVYRAPGPYLDDYKGWLDQTCYTASTGFANFAIPMPSYDEFIAYGQYLANREQIDNAAFANTSFEVAASVSVGAGLALAGAAVPIGLALGAGASLGKGATAAATAVFPFAARAGSLALVAVSSVAVVVGTAIVFIVTVVLASIQLDAQIRMGQRLRDNLTTLTNTPPDLRGQLLEDEARAADTSKSEEERRPKYYGGFYTTFLLGTLPEAEDCTSSGPVIGGGIYTVGCVNAPAPPAVTVDDPVFQVTREGQTDSVDRRTIAVVDPYNGGSSLTRLSGNGWFVHTAVGSTEPTQSLVLPHQGWDGTSYFAQRVWDATNGYRFAVTPVGPGAEAADATVTDTLRLVQADGTRVTVRVVPSAVSAIEVTLPDVAVRNQAATFSATATGAGSDGVGFTWWFPRLGTEGFQLDQPAGVPGSYWSLPGGTVTRAFEQAGAVPVFLQVSSPDGTVQITRYEVNVIDGRQPDRIVVDPPDALRVGESVLLDIAADSGAFVQLTAFGEPTCGTSRAFPVPTLEVTALKAGTCTIRAVTGASDPNVLPAELIVTFRIFQGAQSITAPELDTVAVGAQQTVAATASSGLPVAVTVPLASQDVCVASGTTVTATAAGTCSVLLTQAGNTDYLPAPPVLREFTVRSPVTVTAQDETIVYGGTPAFAFDVSDATVEVTGVECGAAAPLTVGTHPITCGGGSVPAGFTLDYVPGTLTVTPAPAVVTVTPPQVQHSDPLPDLDGSWTVDGLLGTDALSGQLAGCTAAGATVVGGQVTSPAGSYDLTGCAGLTNPNYDVSYAGALTVVPEDVTVAYDGERYFSTGTGTSTGVTVGAVVTQEADGSPGDLSRATVDVLLFASGSTTGVPDRAVTGVAVDASGRVSATVAGVAAGTYRVVVRLSTGNAYFTGPEAVDRLVVYRPSTSATVTGSGWARDSGSADGRGQFEVSVRYTKDRVPQGTVTYAWRNPVDGYVYRAQSTSWAGGTFALDGSDAGITVPARLTVTDPATGAVVTALSGTGHRLRMVAVDGGSGGGNDRLAVTVLDPAGAVVHSVAPSPLGGGNLTVRR